MKLQKHSPALGPKGRFTLEERALRIQAGVEPLHKSRSYTSPERVAEGSVTPSGFMCNTHGSRGFTPACGLDSPSGLGLLNLK